MHMHDDAGNGPVSANRRSNNVIVSMWNNGGEGGDGGNGDKLPGEPWPVPNEKPSPDGGPRVVA
ncbi:hypothetical protein TPA0910_18560 [Streptomyces hygroscopicus subsp. sporocinereus]|uniref:Uncharacterized protein n=1 Tax=Streptomyces hygroscopicus TaxID=1912 RepID=A0ABQ3TVS2_STRHY|nr:hypothetical protein TPA0910_18560 [Streptomyces hygroscopicus]